MKLNAIWLAIFSQFLVCSCIYDTPKGDIFYRTLWTSGEAPLGPITLEFLCEGNVSITCEGGIGSYGKYETYDQTAYFSSLRPQYYKNNIKGLEEYTIQRISPEGLVTVVIEEAHRTDDLLLISWHFSESAISYTTRLVRQSTYEQLQK
jgi:hypothetical protein